MNTDISENETLNISDISGKIHINNNWSDAKIAGKCTGYGNSTHPYVIEDLIIDAENIGNCILIENTNDYFIIENCTLYNSDDTYIITHAGITLINVTNGVITNNTLYDNFDGIYLNSSTNDIIIGNIIYNSINADIELLYSGGNIIYLNSFQSTHIDIFYLYSINTYSSQKKLIYTYNGKNHTNFLGNYWEGYSGLDEDDDGIGDSPHTIVPFEPGPGKSVLTDNYPLIEPLSNYKIIGFAEESPGAIPGYNSFLFIGLISITIIFFLKSTKKGLKLKF
ncbi:MAG: NosD domain-containing protein [Promethearchaeota archaeon]